MSLNNDDLKLIQGRLEELEKGGRTTLSAEQIVGTIADDESKKKTHDAVATWVKTRLDAALLTTRTDPKSAAAVSQIRAMAKEVQVPPPRT
jgi:hypothetical protein